MSVLEIVFIALTALAIVSGLGFLLFLFLFQGQRKQLRSLPTKRFKNKKKNKQVARKRQQVLTKKKRYRTLLYLTLFFSFLFAGGAGYTSYYQAMNLSSNDSDAVVKGYYLLQDFEEQLKLAQDRAESEEKLQQNIRYLSTVMASYGIQKANTLNSKDGQLTLNRYYTAIKQLGMNASTQTKNFYGNPAVVEEFRQDIKKAKGYEKVAFEYFKVDESVLSEAKQKPSEK